MTKSKKKQQQKKKATGKSSSSNSGSTASQIAISAVKTLGPILAKTLATMATGIPFPTSGARAIAAPSPGSVMQLSAPAANGAMVQTTKAKMANTRQGIRVTHREYITDVVHATADEFELLEFEDINPTNARIFPWLSQIATRFETYRFERLRFIYEPQSSTTSVGTVMMAVDYDANDSPPDDKTQMMSYKGAVRSPAWFACCNDSDRSDLQKQKNYYTNVGSQTGTTNDGRLTNVGKFILAFQSESAAYTAGELYVEYDVHLDTPQLQASVQSYSSFFQQITVSGTETESPLPNTNAAFLPKGDLPVRVFSDSGDTFLEFEAEGFYQVTLACVPVSIVVGTGEISWVLTAPVGSEAVVEPSGLGTSFAYQDTQELLQHVIGSFFVQVPNPNELVEIGFDAISATTQSYNNAVIFVTRADKNSIPFPDVFPDSASVSLRSRSLRLLEKRRAAMPPEELIKPSRKKTLTRTKRLAEKDHVSDFSTSENRVDIRRTVKGL